MYINPGKKVNKDGNQKITYAVKTIFSFDFASSRRFLPLCVVFGPSNTATSCQDADFFPAMMYINIYGRYDCYLAEHLSLFRAIGCWEHAFHWFPLKSLMNDSYINSMIPSNGQNLSFLIAFYYKLLFAQRYCLLCWLLLSIVNCNSCILLNES